MAWLTPLLPFASADDLRVGLTMSAKRGPRQRTRQQKTRGPEQTVGTLNDDWFWEMFYTSMDRLPKRRQQKILRAAERDPEVITRIVQDVALGVVPLQGRLIADAIDAQSSAVMRRRRKMFAGFQKRLWAYWGEGFERLDVMIDCLHTFGRELLSDVNALPELGTEPTFVALSRLIARGTRVAGEIQALLLAGFADGALARWRTLYEISITATFIARHGDETATRYLAHEQMQRIRSLELHQEYAERRGDIPIDAEEFERMETSKGDLLAKYGDHFSHEFGWAYTAGKRRIRTFQELEAASDLSHVRPVYRVASAEVHAGADGMRGHGTSVGRTDVHLVPGPSNAGFAKPGMYAAHSIAFLAAAPMLHRASVYRMARASSFGELARRCSQAFQNGEKALARAERTAAAERRKLKAQQRGASKRQRKTPARKGSARLANPK